MEILEVFEMLWQDDRVTAQVEWISLSVKGNAHHYAALGDLIVYCGDMVDGKQKRPGYGSVTPCRITGR